VGDVGEKVVRVGGQLVGGLIGGALGVTALGATPNVSSVPYSLMQAHEIVTNVPSLKAGKFTKQMIAAGPKFVIPKSETSDQEHKRLMQAVTAGNDVFASFGLTIPPVPSPPARVQFQLLEYPVCA